MELRETSILNSFRRALIATAAVALFVSSSDAASAQGTTKSQKLNERDIASYLSSSRYGVFASGRKIGESRRDLSEWSSHYKSVYHISINEKLGSRVKQLKVVTETYEKRWPFALMRRITEENVVLESNVFAPFTRYTELLRSQNGWTLSSRQTGKPNKTVSVESPEQTLGDVVALRRWGASRPGVGATTTVKGMFRFATPATFNYQVTGVSSRKVLGETIGVTTIRPVQTEPESIVVDHRGRIVMVNWSSRGTTFGAAIEERLLEVVDFESLAERAKSDVTNPNDPSDCDTDADPFCFLDDL